MYFVQTRTDTDLKRAGFDWITALHSDIICRFARQKVVRPELFDTCDLASVTCEDFLGERTGAVNSTRKRESIRKEGRVNAINVIPTTVEPAPPEVAEMVRANNSLARVERAFRSLLAVRRRSTGRKRRVRAAVETI